MRAFIAALGGALILAGCSSKSVDTAALDAEFKQLNEACTPQNVSACMDAAAHLHESGNYEYSAWYYDQICSRFQHIPACVKLAAMFEQGQGVRKDEGKAQDIYIRACNSGDKNSCKKVK